MLPGVFLHPGVFCAYECKTLISICILYGSFITGQNFFCDSVMKLIPKINKVIVKIYKIRDLQINDTKSLRHIRKKMSMKLNFHRPSFTHITTRPNRLNQICFKVTEQPRQIRAATPSQTAGISLSTHSSSQYRFIVPS